MKMKPTSDPKLNRLLSVLQDGEYEALRPHLEFGHFKAGEVLSAAGRRMEHVYFPLDCAVSLLYRLDNGESAGVALIGNEGMISVAEVLGGEALPYWTKVETPGSVACMEIEVLKHLVRDSAALREVMLLYAQASLTQIAQSAVCGRHHTLMQQLCQHLLLVNDKSLSDDFRLTQEAIAHMLGMRRESVTEAAGELRGLGAIDYSHGHIHVLDRSALEARCCECYGVVHREYERLMGRANGKGARQ